MVWHVTEDTVVSYLLVTYAYTWYIHLNNNCSSSSPLYLWHPSPSGAHRGPGWSGCLRFGHGFETCLPMCSFGPQCHVCYGDASTGWLRCCWCEPIAPGAPCQHLEWMQNLVLASPAGKLPQFQRCCSIVCYQVNKENNQQKGGKMILFKHCCHYALITIQIF